MSEDVENRQFTTRQHSKSRLIAAPEGFNLEDQIRTKIIATFEIYPIISPTMLNVTLGPSWPAHLWRPVLEELVAMHLVNRVIRSHTSRSSGRYHTYTTLSLNMDHPDIIEFFSETETETESGSEPGSKNGNSVDHSQDRENENEDSGLINPDDLLELR
jgi:hypothetical protein